MAIFAVNYDYGLDTTTRMNARPAHRKWQQLLHESGVLLASGPLAETENPGGLLIVQAADQAAVEDLLAQDPYAELGPEVLAGVMIREWNPVFGPWSPES